MGEKEGDWKSLIIQAIITLFAIFFGDLLFDYIENIKPVKLMAVELWEDFDFVFSTLIQNPNFSEETIYTTSYPPWLDWTLSMVFFFFAMAYFFGILVSIMFSLMILSIIILEVIDYIKYVKPVEPGMPYYPKMNFMYGVKNYEVILAFMNFGYWFLFFCNFQNDVIIINWLSFIFNISATIIFVVIEVRSKDNNDEEETLSTNRKDV